MIDESYVGDLNYNVKEANFIVIQYYNTTKNALVIYLIVLMIWGTRRVGSPPNVLYLTYVFLWRMIWFHHLQRPRIHLNGHPIKCILAVAQVAYKLVQI